MNRNRNAPSSPPLPDVRALSLPEVEALVDAAGQPPYRAQQIFAWLHRHGVTRWGEMKNVPQALREAVAAQTSLGALAVDETQTASDGTVKLRLRCADGAMIESVLIPKEDKLTQCISTQVGCAHGCAFCATATMGLLRNLTSAEIVDQVYRAQAFLRSSGPGEPRISNLVFMGMGEPMANLEAVLRANELLTHTAGADFSPRRITVSTVGVVPGIVAFGERARQFGLAISLHATTNALRDQIIPVNKKWPLESLMATLRRYPLPRRRRITFEYILLAGLNDTPADAKRLPQLLNGIPSKINLLPYNPTRPDHPEFLRPSEDAVENFAEALRAKDLNVTVRHSRGLDIAAACGQLALGSIVENRK